MDGVGWKIQQFLSETVAAASRAKVFARTCKCSDFKVGLAFILEAW